jgi:uncharacterized protein YfkK (UPF0435 family)
MGELQKKMKMVRGKWLENDHDASLSIEAMKIYDIVIKHDKSLPEMMMLHGKINSKLKYKYDNP